MAYFNTLSQLKKALSNLLQLANDADLPEQYGETIIEDSRRAANQEIYSVLLGRGYSDAQIEDWDRGIEFERDLALFWCLVKGGALVIEDTRMRALDRRKELQEVSVTVGGVLANAGDYSGVVSTGLLETDFDDEPLNFTKTTSPSGVKRIPW
jgi:hypothetical protein